MTTSSIPGFDPAKLDPAVAARIPAKLTIAGEDSIRGIDHVDTLRYFATLDLAELRRRQGINNAQFKQADGQPSRNGHADFEAGIKQLRVTETLLTQAVGVTQFDDWVVPAELS